MEAYLVDDLKGLVENPMGQTFADSFVVFDLETTGFSAAKNKIIEIGAVKVVQMVPLQNVFLLLSIQKYQFHMRLSS